MTIDAKLSDNTNIQYGQGNFVNNRGNKIFTQRWTVENPKAVIVLLHGYSDHSHDRIADDSRKYATLGYSSYTMDHEGHGLSEGLRAYVPDFDLLVDDVICYIKRTRELNPGKKLFLYGHSMGGAISLSVSLREPSIVDGVILIAPMVKIVDSMQPHPLIVSALTWLAWVFPTWAIVPTEDLADKGIRVAEKREVARAHPLGYNGRVRLATGLALIKVTSYLQEHLDDVTVPLYICHGTNDMVTSPEVSEELYNRAQSQDKTLRLYEGMWHAITAEPDAHIVFDDITRWIEERSGNARMPSDVSTEEVILEDSEDAFYDARDLLRGLHAKPHEVSEMTSSMLEGHLPAHKERVLIEE